LNGKLDVSDALVQLERVVRGIVFAPMTLLCYAEDTERVSKIESMLILGMGKSNQRYELPEYVK